MSARTTYRRTHGPGSRSIFRRLCLNQPPARRNGLSYIHYDPSNAKVSKRPASRLSAPHGQCLNQRHCPRFSTTAPSETKTSKPGTRRLLESDLIYYKEGLSTPAPITKEDKHTVAAANRVFLHGSEFLYSAAKFSDHPPNPCVPEVVMLGASNVGKSTLINALLGVSDAARVSRVPGSTTLQNVYGVGLPRGWDHRKVTGQTPKPETGLYLVDSPGFGKGSRQDQGDILLSYLAERQSCRGVVFLLPVDKEMDRMNRRVIERLATLNKRTLFLLTKADKNVSGWSDIAESYRELVASTNRRLRDTGWEKGRDGWNPDIHVVAAGSRSRKSSGKGAGVGGVRRAILELAGYNLKGGVSEDPSVTSYGGDIVPFEDIQYKGQN